MPASSLKAFSNWGEGGGGAQKSSMECKKNSNAAQLAKIHSCIAKKTE